MKLHLTQADGSNLITAFSPGTVSINKEAHNSSMIIMPSALHKDWEVNDFDDLTAAHFDSIAALSPSPEVVILGTGDTHRFVHPKLTATLNAKGIPVECMTTDAACRTYNILMSEGRNVAAALIV